MRNAKECRTFTKTKSKGRLSIVSENRRLFKNCLTCQSATVDFPPRNWYSPVHVPQQPGLHQSGVERYCLRFTDGELSNADGVGIVFSSQLPCPQNIQNLRPTRHVLCM